MTQIVCLGNFIRFQLGETLEKENVQNIKLLSQKLQIPDVEKKNKNRVERKVKELKET